MKLHRASYKVGFITSLLPKSLDACQANESICSFKLAMSICIMQEIHRRGRGYKFEEIHAKIYIIPTEGPNSDEFMFMQ